MLIAGGPKNFGGLLAEKSAEAGVAYVAIHYNSAKSQSAAKETKAKVEASRRESHGRAGRPDHGTSDDGIIRRCQGCYGPN